MKVSKFASLVLVVLFSFLLAACGGGVEKETVYIQGATVTNVITNTVTVAQVSNNTPPSDTDISILPISGDPNITDFVVGQKRVPLINFRLSTHGGPVSSIALINATGESIQSIFDISKFILRKSNSGESTNLLASIEEGKLVLDFPNKFYASSQNGSPSGEYYIQADINSELSVEKAGMTLEFRVSSVQAYSTNKKVFIGDDVKGNKIQLNQSQEFALPSIATQSSSVLTSIGANKKSFTFECPLTASYCLLDSLSFSNSYYQSSVSFYDGDNIIRAAFINSDQYSTNASLNVYIQPGTTKEINVVVDYLPLPSTMSGYSDHFYIQGIEANVSGRVVSPKIKDSNCEAIFNDGNCKG